jgi:hypothetical protein
MTIIIKKIMEDKNAVTKDDIKEYLFFNVSLEIVMVKKYPKLIKLN